MSKSKDNFYTVRDLILPEKEGGRGVDPLALRYTLISGHYRKQFNFTFDQLRASTKAIQRYQLAAENIDDAREEGRPGEDAIGDELDEIYRETLEAMADDLNTPKALARAYEGTKIILGRERLSAASARSGSQWLDRINALLGIVDPRGEETIDGRSVDDEAFARAVEQLLQERARARENGEYARADEIREELDDMGVEVMDTPDGTKWRRQASVNDS